MQEEAPSPRIARLVLAVAVAVSVGVAEWLVAAAFDGPISAVDCYRALIGITVLYGAIGIVAAVPSLLHSSGSRARQLAVAVPLGVLAGAAAWSRGSTTWLTIGASIALGLLVTVGASRALARLRWAGSTTLWSSAMTVLLVCAFALALRADSRATPFPVATSIAALALAVAGVAMGSRRARFSTAVSWLGSALLSAAVAYALFSGAQASTGSSAAGPSVLLVTIDTLRADRLGAYGYAPARTPNIDALAREGVLFRSAVAHTYLTGPSHATILSGRLPEHHSVLVNMHRIADSVTTAADLFAEKGYATAAFVAGYPTVDSASGLPSRFDFHDDDLRDFRFFPESAYRVSLLRHLRRVLVGAGFDFTAIDRPAGEVVDVAVDWLRKHTEGPFFVWIHLYDPHLPYQAPREFWSESARSYRGPVDGEWYKRAPEERRDVLASEQNIAQMLELYDAEIAYVDHELGRLFEAAKARASSDELVTVVTADHGESMGEHDLYWARDLYDPTLLVPLVISAPGVAGRSVDAQVRHVDILPTLLEVAGLPPLAGADGSSLLALMHGEATDSTGPALSRIHVDPGIYSRPAASVRHEGFKLIKRGAGWPHRAQDEYVGPATELYDLAKDPGERIDLAEADVAARQRLEDLLRREITEASPSDQPEHSAEVQEKLRALGYVD